jgi:hypothetical protein
MAQANGLSSPELTHVAVGHAVSSSRPTDAALAPCMQRCGFMRHAPVASWLGLAIVSSIVALCFADAAFGSEKVSSADGKPACVQVRAEARPKAVGYDHWVFINNQCDSTAACDISTNISPATLTVTVQAGQVSEVLTFRGSPARTFTPYVTCQLAAARP